jgi:hypothetical protein
MDYKAQSAPGDLSIRAYFDESGTWSDPGVTVVAIGGCVSSATNWAHFEPSWRQVLSKYKVSRLHMREGSFQRGEYTGWTKDDWQGFLGDFSSCYAAM